MLNCEFECYSYLTCSNYFLITRYCKRKIAATKKTQDDDYEAVRKVNEEKP